MDFGIENRALQQLVLAPLKAQATLHPQQFPFHGGREAAITHVRDALRSGFKHVAELDIEDCFASTNEDQLHALLPLPKEVIDHVISSRHLPLYCSQMYSKSEDIPDEELDLLEEYVEDARRGLPQGSATSSVVAEILLAPVMAQLPSSGLAVAYADNFLVMAPSKQKLAATISTLRASLDAHLAGPYRLNPPKVYAPGSAIEFLGYRLKVDGERCSIEPSDHKLRAFTSEFSKRLERIKRTAPLTNPHRCSDLRRYVLSWSRAFALWPEAEQHSKRHMAMLDEVTSS